MTAHRLYIAALSLMWATACASIPTAQSAETQAVEDDTSTAIAQLVPKTLKPGECGLFMFTRETPRRFVLFSLAASNQANIMLDESEATLPLTAAGGDIFGQFLTVQTFSNDVESLSLRLTPGDLIENGQRVPVASLIRTTADGWEVITPLQGVRACKPDQLMN